MLEGVRWENRVALAGLLNVGRMVNEELTVHLDVETEDSSIKTCNNLNLL